MPADDAAGEAEEGLVDVVADFPADPRPPEPVQQRDGLFHYPAVHAQARAMLRAAPGDNRGDPRFPGLLAVLVVVIAAVGVDLIRALAGRPRRPRTGGMAWMRGMSWVTSLRFPPVSDTASGMPCALVIRWCFEPGRARSTGLGPVLGHLSAPARESCQSPPWTSPAPRRRSARPAAIRAAAATPRLRASPAAAASRLVQARAAAGPGAGDVRVHRGVGGPGVALPDGVQDPLMLGERVGDQLR